MSRPALFAQVACGGLEVVVDQLVGARMQRQIPPGTNELIHDYLEVAGHAADDNGALLRPIRNNRSGELEKALDPDMV